MRPGMSRAVQGWGIVWRHNTCSQRQIACHFDSESSNFANAHKYHLRNIWRERKKCFRVYRSFSCLRAARADADFSICRFVKHHGMFWFSIKNILPKWFRSPTLENKRVSSLSPSSMCSNIQWRTGHSQATPWIEPSYRFLTHHSPGRGPGSPLRAVQAAGVHQGWVGGRTQVLLLAGFLPSLWHGSWAGAELPQCE